jgi:hypothetical protein
MTPLIPQILRDHTTLSIACIDRLYINGYVPSLQYTGGLHAFLNGHLGFPIASPALLKRLHDRFIGDIDTFAQTHTVPIIEFEKGVRKDDVAAARRARFSAPQGVVFIGKAQEKASSFKAKKIIQPNGLPDFQFSRQPVFVNHYYFYLQDPQWGPAFVKLGSYLPYPVKLCLNGHEWAKCQLRQRGIPFESLDNGFRSCADPELLQQLCDQLSPHDVQDFFNRWSNVLPWPLLPEDREAGFDHRLSIWQIEFSLTHIFDRPVMGRHFFEQVIRDNLDLGRPDRVSLLFPSRFTKRTPSPARGYRTRVITQGVNPSLHVEYKHSHVKQYFKEEAGLRTETTINDATDFRVNKGLENLPRLREVGQEVNRRLLEAERLSQQCVLESHELETLGAPSVHGKQRAPALRFGVPRVMALLHALCMFLLLPRGFDHKTLRVQVASLLGLTLEQYTASMMTYDLRRLRLKGLISRQPGTHRYLVTPLGLRVASFYTRIHLRLLQPGWAALLPAKDPIPRPLRTVFDTLEAEIDKLCEEAGLRPAA